MNASVSSVRVHAHLSHLLGQHPAEGLNPLDVLAGVVVAGLGELGEREDGRELGRRDRLDLLGDPLLELPGCATPTPPAAA